MILDARSTECAIRACQASDRTEVAETFAHVQVEIAGAVASPGRVNQSTLICVAHVARRARGIRVRATEAQRCAARHKR